MNFFKILIDAIGSTSSSGGSGGTFRQTTNIPDVVCDKDGWPPNGKLKIKSAIENLDILHNANGLKINSANKQKAVYGDILVVQRTAYSHYGVYTQDGTVIHYTSQGSDISKENKIIETSVRDFIKDSNEYFVLNLDSSVSVYSPSDTVKRAKSRIGEKLYNVMANNCEHFAMWCKTGKSESSQIDNLINTAKLVAVKFSSSN